MITLISGTNRPNSKTAVFAQHFKQLFEELAEEEIRYIDLAEPAMVDILRQEMYSPAGQSPALGRLQDEAIIPAHKFFFVYPEYNGSFPGMLKLFLDAISIREYGPTFKGKKAGLAGIASGRAGNLRGIDHLTGVLHHVGTLVMPKMLPISGIGKLLDDQDQIQDEATKEAMRDLVKAFIAF
ncbi:MAG: NAD(P)H-dependent oxidoreductase [Bacteroidota bacterium]